MTGARRLGLILALASGCTGAIGDESEPASGDPRPGTGDTGARPSVRPGAGGASGTSGGGGSAAAPDAVAGACPMPGRRVWRLTPAQMRRTFESVLGAKAIDPALEAELARYVPPSAPFAGADEGLTGSSGFVQELFEGARDMARAAAGNLAGLHPCFAGGVSRTCVQTMIAELGARAWRRPVTPEEVTDYLGTYDAVAAKASPNAGVEYVLRRLLAAPDMVFRFELGAAAGAAFALTPFELANALAYTLTDGPPDAELMAAARDGSLKDAAAIERQARRLLAQSAGARGVHGFVRDLFHTSDTASPAQHEEARRFVEHALWNDPAGGRLATLLTAGYTFATGELQKHYGWSKSAATSYEQVTPPAAEARAGILTRGAVVTAFGNRSDRGKFLRETLLCTTVPKPPIDVDQDLDAQAQALSKQLGRAPSADEILARHMADPACSACHKVIDPLGKPFVAFDDKGIWRAREAATTRPYDTSAEIVATPDMDGPVKDPRDLARKLGDSKAVRACVAQQALRFVAGRDLGEADRCRIADAVARFERGGGDVKALFVELVASDWFRLRRAP